MSKVETIVQHFVKSFNFIMYLLFSGMEFNESVHLRLTCLDFAGLN